MEPRKGLGFRSSLGNFTLNDSRDPLYPMATLSNSRILGSLGLAHGNTASWNSVGGAKPDWLKRVGGGQIRCMSSPIHSARRAIGNEDASFSHQLAAN